MPGAHLGIEGVQVNIGSEPFAGARPDLGHQHPRRLPQGVGHQRVRTRLHEKLASIRLETLRRKVQACVALTVRPRLRARSRLQEQGDRFRPSGLSRIHQRRHATGVLGHRVHVPHLAVLVRRKELPQYFGVGMERRGVQIVANFPQGQQVAHGVVERRRGKQRQHILPPNDVATELRAPLSVRLLSVQDRQEAEADEEELDGAHGEEMARDAARRRREVLPIDEVCGIDEDGAASRDQVHRGPLAIGGLPIE
mmetsp:Transcript_5115/g.15110  ORF Transcript_5115/g.15110 Transcript_5115/m.15110 type:complete len:253 (+) Transcript_5115:821-1579(+)